MPRCHPHYIDFGCLTILVAYVYMMSLLIISISVYVFLQQNPPPAQVENLSLENNLLQGTLPESWSECSSVSLYLDTVFDQCEPWHCKVRPSCHVAIANGSCMFRANSLLQANGLIVYICSSILLTVQVFAHELLASSTCIELQDLDHNVAFTATKKKNIFYKLYKAAVIFPPLMVFACTMMSTRYQATAW